jgi:hypothetical protein
MLHQKLAFILQASQNLSRTVKKKFRNATEVIPWVDITTQHNLSLVQKACFFPITKTTKKFRNASEVVPWVDIAGP